MYKDIFESIRNEAEKRNLRERTIQLYCSDVSYFLRWIGKNVSDLTLEDAESFLTAKRLEGRSPETHNHYRSAIKFLYKKVLKTVWDDDTVPAMKRERNLPAVLSRDEINAIIDATPNLKHKAIIATMYSSGLRVSEVVHLHYDDISRTNMTIHVRETKGRIDRYTILSQKNLDLLTEYWYKCGRPKDILFPSSWTGGYLDITGVNQFFKKSAKLAGITRHVSSPVILILSICSHLLHASSSILSHVRETKGRIDRYTILSQKNLDLLTEYWYKCGRPKDILFPSSWSGGYLDIASVNQFFKKSAKLAGINRHVSSHACRHSFASHLFESGTDIKYIQSLLGHVDPRSTDVYLHVSNKTLLGIRSPFDNPEGGES